MARRLRPVGTDFVTTAPVRHVFVREVAAPVAAVYGALVDVPGWAEWFPQVTAARPVAAGAGRDITLTGGIRFRETVIAAQEPKVYAYRVDVTNLPGLRAIAEEWRLTPTGSGTRVRWTFATDGTAAYRLAVKVARAGQARAFRDALRALDRRLGT
ncbi:SRPBCC family protein [Streptomyces sp. NEAU-H22]|uniref:SRPBCC family protein n=1 Tax=unclassified Streptomyces TaxID=2593676 RepID=UPI002250FEA0|nr:MULTISPECIES: SRPBCC family protein [unclassified Streptomyces]MCX3290216.1 SRPBCC family protein [Streptomyces sp. NEAU-H22]WMD06972.1 SRPBCC family protein [Streptomyces sp. FXY-T5]